MSLNLLRERRDLVRALRGLTDRQQSALSGRDYDGLIEILGEKKTVLEGLAAKAAGAREWIASREEASASERAEGESLISETNQLLAEAARAEDAAVAELTQLRDATQRELSEISAAGRVHLAYRDALAPVTHRSLDVDR